ncbi:AarF/UbiB family protein [Bacteriovorax sp. PP10]|uniref:AarF/UbiB family protein n=1 Tax=Bacteriovorax antarcticus TaxID=3088717 RepID=A0ABU5VWX0_9BACT|nr:AarF/UbiB family protein [Bacteriovorax sp. PP10]MEA9357546.1 AarF/UbiB family protein [Bacteriovorax sp. PP10]
MSKNKINLIPIILILTLFLSACSFQKSVVNQTPSDQNRVIANSDLEILIDEFKGYVDANLSVERKQEIKTVQENLLKYLIEATESTDAYKIKIYREANNYFNKVYPLVLQNIRNEKLGVKEFNVIKKAPLWSLKEELRYLNKEADSLPSPKVKIDLIEGLTLFSEIYKNIDQEQRTQMGANYETTVQKFMGQEFNLHPSYAELETLVEGQGTEEQKILKVINLVDSKISKHEARIRHIGSEIGKSGQVDMNNPQIKVVVSFMDYYFNKLPSDVVKTIMSELVTGGAKLPEEEVMKIVFQNTGPGLGKVLQQIGKEKGVGPEFSKLTAILESSGKEVPFHLVEEVVKGDKGGFEVRSIEPKSVGTGTIAQVNKATIWVDDKEKDVALRFLKPGVAARCKEDIAILRQFVPDHEALFAQQGIEDLKMMSTLIDSVEKFLNDEVDLSVAVERQKKAFEVYNRTVKVSADKFDMLEMRVPEVYLPPNGKSNLHVQEFAAGGVKFANLKDNAVKKAVAQEMVRMWFEEALFRSGFLNADLHQGNFRVVLVEENNKIKILLYDFGLSSTLSKEEQRAFLLVGAGAYMKSSKTLTDGLMVSMNSEDPALRAKLLKDIKAEMKAYPNKKPEDWVVWCVQKNYFVSDNLGALARGSLLLKQLPESMGESEMFKDTIVKTALANLGHAMADRDYDYPLTKIDMLKLGIAQSKSYCIDLIKKFFGN